MNIVILGGASPRHKAWVRQLAQQLSSHGDTVVYLDYRHWDAGGETDLDYEIEQAKQLVATLDNEYVIVAKSIGTVIATTAIGRGLLSPARCVFLGFPLKIADEFPEIIKHIAALPKTTVLQNEHDPAGSYADAASYFSNAANANVTVRSTPGDTHDYTDFSAIASLVE